MLRIIIFLGIMLCQLILGGCGKSGPEYEKLRDLEFTIIDSANIPESLITLIDEKKSDPFQLSYTVGDDMYLVIGYGVQQTCGYSIQVNECYETQATVYVDTTLLGSQAKENVVQKESYPYIVIKTETIADKLIEFH